VKLNDISAEINEKFEVVLAAIDSAAKEKDDKTDDLAKFVVETI